MIEPLPTSERCPVNVRTADETEMQQVMQGQFGDWQQWHDYAVKLLTDAFDIRHLNGQDSYGYDKDMHNSGALEVTPGGGVMAYAQGRQILNVSLGYSDMGARLMWTPDTISALRSCSKIITAVALFDMINRGYLNMSDIADSYVDYSNWPTGGKPGLGAQTIANLMSHRAKSGGIMWKKSARSHRDAMGMLDSKNDFWNWSLDNIDKWGPGSGGDVPHPGSGGDYDGVNENGACIYEDHNYIFLAQIMEAALAGANPATAGAVSAGGDLNETYEGYCEKYVLKPLGMADTYFSATGAPQIINAIADHGKKQLHNTGFRSYFGNPLNCHVAAPHFCVAGHGEPYNNKIYRGFLDNTPDRVIGSGNWFSTLNDLSKLFIGIEGLIGAENYALMNAKVGPNRQGKEPPGSFQPNWYGYGMGLNDFPADESLPVPGETYAIATGVWLGYACIMQRSLETDITIIYHGIRNSLNDVAEGVVGKVGPDQKGPGQILIPIFAEAVRKFGAAPMA